MGWLQSLMAPLKKLWIRAHSSQKKSTFTLIFFFLSIYPHSVLVS